MTATSANNLEPLLPIIGRWRTSGTVMDEQGTVMTTVSGTDTYRVLPGENWIAHDVDVTIGGDRTLAHELIGGVHPDGGWQMHSFDQQDGPSPMRLGQAGPGLLLLDGDGIRSWFRIRDGDGRMATRWEREVDRRWLPWMDMRFERD